MTITAAASHQDQGQMGAFDPIMSYKIYHPRQNDDAVLQAEEDRRRPRNVPWATISSTEFNNTGDSNSNNNLSGNFSPSSAAAVSAPPPPPPLQPPPLHLLQELPCVNGGFASAESPVFHSLDSPEAPTRAWAEQYPQQYDHGRRRRRRRRRRHYPQQQEEYHGLHELLGQQYYDPSRLTAPITMVPDAHEQQQPTTSTQKVCWDLTPPSGPPPSSRPDVPVSVYDGITA